MSNTNNQPQPQQKQPSAKERLEILEQGSASLFQLNDMVVKDIDNLKKALQLINNKIDAMAKASVAGEELSDEVLNRIMIENNVRDLAGKVAALVQQGILAPEEQVSDNAFVVGQELDNDNNVTNPRLQFSIRALKADMQAKILGSKVGDTLKITENLQFKVSESYKIQQPPQASTPEITPEAAALVDAPAASEPSPAQSN